MKAEPQTIRLGFSVPDGEPVDIPLAHTFITGQTQLSGKTTALRAIAERSGRRALAFVTKRGEDLPGRRIRPYLPREGDRQIHWRLVETIMAAALGQRNMKWERGAIVNAAKGATTLGQVRDNVARLREKHKKAYKVEELYMLLGEYLDLVLPEMAALDATDTLELAPGLNVMDITGIGQQTQGMVIRAALEFVMHHERDVLTIFPEAWEFAPADRGAPAKDEAIGMARKGAVLGNFLLCDSQDIKGVDTQIRQGASVWILGVQRELNELKRTVQMIPAGIKRPKPEEIATLELGQFYACWGRHAVKTYVQPARVGDDVAIAIARGLIDVRGARTVHALEEPKEDAVTREEADTLRQDNRRLMGANEDLERQVAQLTEGVQTYQSRLAALEHDAEVVNVLRQGFAALLPAGGGEEWRGAAPAAVVDEEEIVRRVLARVPAGGGGAVVQVTPPEKLRADFQREEADRILAAVRGLNPLGRRVLKLLEGLEGRRLMQKSINERLGRSINSNRDMGEAVREMKELGLIDADSHGIGARVRAKITEDLSTYAPSADDVDAVYQRVLYELSTEAQAA